jgi:hypothetical protein
MKQKRALLFILILVAFASLVPLSGLANGEDWSDGPGNATDADTNGISKSVYVTLWNLDTDETPESVKYPGNDADSAEGADSWKGVANLAGEIDFSSYSYSKQVRQWNGIGKNEFEEDIQDKDEVSYVPGDKISELKSGKFIKDGYITLYSLDPSIHTITDKANETDAPMRVKSSGRVISVIDYRVEEPASSAGPNTTILWTEKETSIDYHKLSYFPECDESSCLLGKDSVDEHVRTLKYNNLERREHDLYLKGKVSTKWNKTVKTCEKFEVPDNITDGKIPGGNETDTNTTDESNESSDDSTVEDPPGATRNLEPIGMDIQPLSLNRHCGPNQRSVETTTTVEEDLVFSHKLKVEVKGDMFGRVQYAKLPNSYEVRIRPGNKWTHAEIPGGTEVASGWRTYTSRAPGYTTVYGFSNLAGERPDSSVTDATYQGTYRDHYKWVGPEEYTNYFNDWVQGKSNEWFREVVAPIDAFDNIELKQESRRPTQGSKYSSLNTEDPPIQNNIYPDGNGVTTYYDGGASTPEILYVGGRNTTFPNLPKNVAFETPKDMTPETNEIDFKKPNDVVLRLKEDQFNPSGKVKIHGVMSDTAKIGSDVRTVKNTNVSVDVNNVDGEEKRMNITVHVTDSSGNPVETRGREGYISIYGEKYNTNNDGRLTTIVDIKPSTTTNEVIFVAEDWWRVDESKQAYIGSSGMMNQPAGVKFSGLIQWIFQMGVILYAFYWLFDSTIDEALGTNISGIIETAVKLPYKTALDTLNFLIGK